MADNPPCYFDELELARTATRAQIKKAYHRKALYHHHDKVAHRNFSEEQMQQHKAAYERARAAFDFLINEEKRSQYLQSLEQSPENRDGMDAASVPEPDMVPELSDGFKKLSLRSLRVRLQQTQPKDLETVLRGLKIPVLRALSRFLDKSQCSQANETNEGRREVRSFMCCNIKIEVRVQDSGDPDFLAKLDAWEIELKSRVKAARRQMHDAIQVIRESIKQLEQEEFQGWPLPVSYENHSGCRLPQVQSFELMLRYRVKAVAAKERQISAKDPKMAKLKTDMSKEKELSPQKESRVLEAVNKELRLRPSSDDAPEPGGSPLLLEVVLGNQIPGPGQAAVPVAEAPKGMLLVGLPDSGKTFAMKKIMEVMAMVPSMRHIVVFDVKGDWVQTARRATHLAEDATAACHFEDECDVRVYTFASDLLRRATLSPFPFEIGRKPAEAERTNLRCWTVCLKQFVFDVLVTSGVVHKNWCKFNSYSSTHLLLHQLPSMKAFRGLAGGVPASDKEKFGDALLRVAEQACTWKIELTEQLPASYVEFADMLQEFANNHNFLPLSRLDVRAVADHLKFFANDLRFSLVYCPRRGDPSTNVQGDVYALGEQTLFRSSPVSGKRVMINIVSLINLELDERRRVVQSVLTRVERWGEESGGTQSRPRTLVVLDEAHEALPRVGDNSATGMVALLLRKMRSHGVCVLLGTQQAKDLDLSILDYIQGPRFCGRLSGRQAAHREVLEKVFHAPAKRKKEYQTMVAEAGKYEFVYCTGASEEGEIEGPAKKMKFGSLSRLHEDAGPWTGDESRLNHPMQQLHDLFHGRQIENQPDDTEETLGALDRDQRAFMLADRADEALGPLGATSAPSGIRRS